MNLKDGIHWGMNVLPIYMCYICVCHFYMLYLLSSPYLFVIGDDRVRGTREQMMLMQVVLVKLSCGEGIAWEFYLYIYFLLLEISCQLF